MGFLRRMAAFPQYRRSRDGRHAYRIEGPRAFTEVQVIGSRAVIHRVKDAAYPEQVRIREMIDGSEPYIAMDEREFQRMLDLHQRK